jgi:hypothetical protein
MGRRYIVAAVCIRHRHDHGLFCEVQPGRRVERVEVRPDHCLHLCCGISRNVHEDVHRTFECFHGLNVCELEPCQVHGDERIEIEIGVDADGVRLFFGDGRRFRAADRNRKRRNKQCEDQGNEMPHLELPI